MARQAALRRHAVIGPLLDHLVARDPHFRKFFKPVDVDAIIRIGSACTYDAFVRTIVGQQVSTAAAATIWGRIAALADPFTPQAVAVLPDTVLRGAGLSGQKVAYLRGLTQAIVEGRFDPKKLARMDDAQVIEAVTALKGFGRWSAEMMLIFALKRPDVFSSGDLGLREGMKRVLKLDERPTEKQAVILAERWAGHRTAASLLLWHACTFDMPAKKLPAPLKAKPAPGPLAKPRSRATSKK